MSNLATLSQSGRAALLKALMEKPLHLAWGVGRPEWDEDPSGIPSYDAATGLVSEVGRRLVTQASFAVKSETGDIVVPVGKGQDGQVLTERYQLVAEPTPNLYLQVKYDFGDAIGHTIRELALFSGSRTDAWLPPGQRYFLPGEVSDPGIMVAAQALDKEDAIVRSASKRHTEEFVLAL